MGSSVATRNRPTRSPQLAGGPLRRRASGARPSHSPVSWIRAPVGGDSSPLGQRTRITPRHPSGSPASTRKGRRAPDCGRDSSRPSRVQLPVRGSASRQSLAPFSSAAHPARNPARRKSPTDPAPSAPVSRGGRRLVDPGGRVHSQSGAHPRRRRTPLRARAGRRRPERPRAIPVAKAGARLAMGGRRRSRAGLRPQSEGLSSGGSPGGGVDMGSSSLGSSASSARSRGEAKRSCCR
jgi:hypothetical protein